MQEYIYQALKDFQGWGIWIMFVIGLFLLFFAIANQSRMETSRINGKQRRKIPGQVSRTPSDDDGSICGDS